MTAGKCLYIPMRDGPLPELVRRLATELGRRPSSQQRQNVEGEGGGSIEIYRLCAGSFREFLACGIDHDRQMTVAGGRQTERPLKMNMRRGGVEQVDSTDDVSHALLGVVDDHGQMIGRQAVAPEYYIIPRCLFERLVAFAL